MGSRAEVLERNLLALSQEQDQFKIALREWEHTGLVTDHLAAVEECQLCGHSNLRYHFEILNRHTGARLFGLSPEELELVWSSLSLAQKQRFAWLQIYQSTGRHEEDETVTGGQQEEKDAAIGIGSHSREEPLQDQASTKLKSLPGDSVIPTLPEMPIRYVERAHRYAITFIARDGRPLKRVFRGDLEASRGFIEQEVETLPDCTRVEVRLTLTKELVDSYEKS